MKIVLLLMTSRSGSSMIAKMLADHGFYWTSDPTQNPAVGGKKVKYRTFENQIVKKFNKIQFGVPLGNPLTFDDVHANLFEEMVRNEYGHCDQQHPRFWKGAAEFFPIWYAISQRESIEIQPVVIWRPRDKVIESLIAKQASRGLKVFLPDVEMITSLRYEFLSELAAEYAFPVIETEQVVRGDLSTLKAAMESYGYVLNDELCLKTIDISKWETER